MQDVLSVLSARLEHLEGKKSSIVAEYDARINEEVERYRTELRANVQEEIDSQVKCIEEEIVVVRNWLEEESAKVVMPEKVEEPIVETAPVEVPVATPVAPIPAVFQRFKTI